MPLYNERDRDPRTRPWSARMADDNKSVASTGSRGSIVDWMGLVDLRSSLCMSVGMGGGGSGRSSILGGKGGNSGKGGNAAAGGDGGESKSEKRKREREKRRAARLQQQQKQKRAVAAGAADNNGDDDGGESKETSARGGNNTTTTSGGGGGTIDRYAPSSPSRYDPKAMNRIVDITDLADDDDSELDDSDVEVMMSTETTGGKYYGLDRKISNASNANNKHQQKGGSGIGGLWGDNNNYNNNILGRRTLVLIASVGVIMGASLGIGSIVLSKKDGDVFPQQQQQQLISLQVGRSQVHLDYSNSNNNQGEGVEQQNLLEIAEQIVVACGSSGGGGGGSEEECRELCQDRLCCFIGENEEKEEEEYSCVNDESMECAVYAGCEMLAERRN